MKELNWQVLGVTAMAAVGRHFMFPQKNWRKAFGTTLTAFVLAISLGPAVYVRFVNDGSSYTLGAICVGIALGGEKLAYLIADLPARLLQRKLREHGVDEDGVEKDDENEPESDQKKEE